MSKKKGKKVIATVRGFSKKTGEFKITSTNGEQPVVIKATGGPMPAIKTEE